ncbi:kinase-like domain-containing protein [Mycena capillaripes]|nr:kinase-like domain-containing protein [Mycena capillaripes]
MSQRFQVEELQQLLLSEDARNAVFKLRGNEAVAFMDKLLLTLDSLRLDGHTDQLLLRAEACLLKLSQKSHLLPTSFLVENVICDSRDPSGGGGFADVYQGRIGNAPVALKVLRIHVAGALLDEVEKNFCREALIWRQLQHPNILPFLGISKTVFPGRLCMVAPWMAAGSILGCLVSQPMSDRKALLLQVASGLIYLHERSPPVIHGDIRGANILIDSHGNACLADFGLAILADSLATITSSSTSATRGNVRWLPPEVLNPSQFGGGYLRKEPAVDVYSFAGLCYEIYTGEVPYHTQRSEFQVMTDVLGGTRPPRPPASMTKGDLSDSVWHSMLKCWAHNPSERPTMFEVANNFQEAEAQVFGITPMALNLHEMRMPSGKLNCVQPFLSQNGQELIFLGYEDGLWVGSRNSGGLRRVSTLKNVSHCAVLHDLGVVLILGDKPSMHQSIWACTTHDLLTAENLDQNKLHRITAWNHRVTMFIAGKIHGKNTVVYLRRCTGREYQNLHVHGMICAVLEANEQMISNYKKPSWLARIVQKDPQWFSEVGISYTDFAYHDEKGSQPLLDLCFIDGGWAILTPEDVVICPRSKVKKDLYAVRKYHFRTLEADSTSRKHNPPPIGITASDAERYLICYPTFGAFVNRDEEDRVYWKVPVHQVAFHWPYALLFSDDQIEVRNICTGTLIQMLRDFGTDLRCLWNSPPFLDDQSGIICVSNDSNGARMLEIQPIPVAPAQVSAASSSSGSSGFELLG